jgi:hypothetical protein
MRNHKIHTETPFTFLDENFNDVEFEKIQLEVTINSLDKISTLSKTAIKLYKHLRMDAFREDKILYFDIKEAKEYCEFKQDKSIYNALKELVKAGILAGRKNPSEFYYNPKYICHKKEIL